MSILRFFSFFAVLSMLGLLAGCQATDLPAPPKLQDVAYTPMALNARKLDIINNWAMPMEEPYQEHLLTPNPSDVLTDWAARVLLPAGGSGDLTLEISKGSVTITELAQSVKLLDSLNDQQESIIKVSYTVLLVWVQPVGGRQAAIEVQASASKTLPESSRPVDYDVAIQETILLALAKLDQELRAKIAAVDGLVLP